MGLGLQRMVRGSGAVRNSFVILACVVGGAVAPRTIAAVEPTYAISDLPQQLFCRGGALRFGITDLPGSVFSVDASPAPMSEPTIDHASGMFEFSPAAGDAGNFTVAIHSSHPDGTSFTTSTIISVFGNLPPEYVLVSKQRRRPEDADQRYTLVTETADQTHRTFNTLVERKLVNVVVSGKTVVFDSHDDSDGLMSRLNKRADVESLSIYAETLIIRSPLYLPQSTVRIFARHLRFEDVAGQPAAMMDTTPLSWEVNPGLGRDGADGLTAGSVTASIQTFFSSPGPSTRFFLQGGTGQDAGIGKAGDDGRSMPCYHNVMTVDGTCVVHVHQFAGATSFGADNTWPGDGGAATRPGRPGAGGDGGDFTSNMGALLNFVSNLAGAPGTAAQHVDGGKAGEPIHALSVELWDAHGRMGSGGGCPPALFGIPCTLPGPGKKLRVSRIEGEHDSHGGTAADPGPIPLTAASGNTRVSGNADDWLHPIMLRALLSDVEDAFLGGDLDYPQSVLSDYVPLIDLRLQAWAAERILRDQVLSTAANADRGRLQAENEQSEKDHNSFVQLRLAMEDVSLKLRNNLDYFDHPAGWVPQLSFAATLNGYAEEVKQDIPILYLSYYVQASSADRQRHIASIEQTTVSIQAEVMNAADAFNAEQAALPELEAKAAAEYHDIDFYEQEVSNRQMTLIARAQQIVEDRHKVPFWKQALGVLSAAASVCPVGVPIIGAIGKGLDVIADAGDQGLVQSAQQLGSLADEFSHNNIHAAVQQYHNVIAGCDPHNASSAGSYVKGLVPVAEDVIKEYDAVGASLQAKRAPSDEVAQEIAQLEASDADLAELAERVSALNSAKVAFDEQVSETITRSASLSRTIMSDWSAIDANNRALSAATGALDHEAVQQVAEFGRRARDRLLLFQYYLAKAYEYRFLQPYPGELNLGPLLDKLVTMTSQSHNENFEPLTDEDFKSLSSVYKEVVQEYVGAAIDYFQTHPRAQRTRYPYVLSHEQLDSLNSEGVIRLDLGSEIPRIVGQDNRRLVSINVRSAAATDPKDGSQPTAIHLQFDHDGTSTLRSNKQSYRFDHHLHDTDRPFEWSGTLSGNIWAPDQIAPDYIATLKQLLNLHDSDSDYEALFANPGLESIVSISRQAGDAQDVTSLNLEVVYDYDSSAALEYPLEVVAPEGWNVLTDVDARDDSGRTLGRGSFVRFFPRNATVRLSVPQKFNGQTFVAWHVTGMRDIHSPTVTIDITRNEAIRASMEYR